MKEFIISNWHLIVVGIIVVVAALIAAVAFIKTPKAERLAQVKAWMLQAVIWAEKEYGGGTGRMKLSAVYAAFCTQLPWLAKVMSFEKFSELVDDALVEMGQLLEKNTALATFVEG